MLRPVSLKQVVTSLGLLAASRREGCLVSGNMLQNVLTVCDVVGASSADHS